ncbi:MAG TPA: ZIP family metal transporter [Candidatus Paceibacterota bacterium]|nr:ZIP family metal transporter [Candidatus Paceibacterota bacterium]
MLLSLIALAAFASTLIGGLFALRLRDRLHLVLGFSAGAVIGVAFFDLLPESLALTSGAFDTGTVTAVVALGFLAYMLLDRLVLFHGQAEAHEHGTHAHRGIVGAGSLSFHSFLDGMAIGLSFQVAPAVGIIVTTAVLVHDFSDGINAVNLIMRHGGERTQALRWLITDAVAPVLGIAAASFFALSEVALGMMLALFTGFFLYIGAGDLLPESHHAHPKALTTVMTALGIGVMYVAVSLAGV